MKTKYKITAQTKYYKWFLPTMYAVILTAFFGCQNKEDKKQKNKTIEITADTSAAKSVSLDKTEIDKKSEQIPQLQSKTNKIKTQKTDEKNNSKSEKKSNPKSETADSDKTNTSTKTANSAAAVSSQINAEFPGGIDRFHTFFMKEYKKPEEVNYWKLNFTLAFAVEKNGSISFLECSPAVEEPLEKEIIRVLSLCPKWQPGELNGKKIRMQYSVPILLK